HHPAHTQIFEPHPRAMIILRSTRLSAIIGSLTFVLSLLSGFERENDASRTPISARLRGPLVCGAVSPGCVGHVCRRRLGAKCPPGARLFPGSASPHAHPNLPARLVPDS